MSSATINAKIRKPQEPTSRALRREGQIPAIYYNSKHDVKYVQFDNIELLRVLKSEWGLLEVNVGGEVLPCVIREVQRHPVTGNLVHVDLFGVDRDQTLRTKVSLNFVGIARGVKDDGGMLDVLIHELEIECLPHQIPGHLDVEISHLGMNEGIKIGDLKFDELMLHGEPEDTVVHVVPPRKVEEAAEGEAAAEAEAAEPEVITEKKDEAESD